MTTRSKRTWAMFAACVVLVALALLQITREVLDLEKKEARARDEARVHEAMRLALWRMDSMLAPVLAQEAARPASDYPVAGGPPLPPRPSPSGSFRTWFVIDSSGRPTPGEIAPFVAALQPPLDKSEMLDWKDEGRRLDSESERFDDKKLASDESARVAKDKSESAPDPRRQTKDEPGSEKRTSAHKRGEEDSEKSTAKKMKGGEGGTERAGIERKLATEPGKREELKSRDLSDEDAHKPLEEAAEKDQSVRDRQKRDSRSAAGGAKARAAGGDKAPAPGGDKAPAGGGGRGVLPGATLAPPPPPPKANPEPKPESRPGMPAPMDELAASRPARQTGDSSPRQTLDSGFNLPQMGATPQFEQQLQQSEGEYQSRSKMNSEVLKNAMAQTAQILTATPDMPAGLVFWSAPEAGALEPRWISGPGGTDELFLVRTVLGASTRKPMMQGIWCDWAKVQSWLLGNTRDLFSEARLVPAPHPSESDHAAMLASIPASFLPGPLTVAATAPPSPTRAVLAVAWIAALAAIAAVGGVLRAAMSLGERRGRFVSAVTHELRTPLTTFRMYSQMLADGMVAESARPEYLATLKEESERLTRVVESVLLYSRLEEGRGGAHRETIAARALIDRVLPALLKRASDGGMTPATLIEVAPEASLLVDVQAVEQILLNLVDNACKYAAPADPRLELSWSTEDRKLRVRCRDFGPGIPHAERDDVFLPFHRGEKDAAGTTPGVGLGLALARGLARALGGDLVLDPGSQPGAGFLLTIPLSSGRCPDPPTR